MVRGRHRGVPFFFWSDGTSSVSSAPRCRAALLRIPGRFRPTKRASRDAVSFFSNGKSESYTFLVVTASFLVVMAVVVNIYLQIQEMRKKKEDKSNGIISDHIYGGISGHHCVSKDDLYNREGYGFKG